MTATDDIDNDIDQDNNDTEETAEPAAAVAKRIPGADFEPGPGSPLNPDGSPKLNPVAAYGRYSEAAQRKKDADRECMKWWDE